MRKLGLFVFLVVGLLSGIAVFAQSDSIEEFSECDRAGLSTLITEALQAAGDDEEALDPILGEVASAISRVRAACAELSYEGVNAKLIGPLELPAGYYRVRVTTEGFFIAKAEVLDGSCDTGFSLFNLMGGAASEGAEALVVSEGCTLLLETDNVTAPWTLVFERID